MNKNMAYIQSSYYLTPEGIKLTRGKMELGDQNSKQNKPDWKDKHCRFFHVQSTHIVLVNSVNLTGFRIPTRHTSRDICEGVSGEV